MDQEKIKAEKAKVKILDNDQNEITSDYVNRYVPYEEIGTNIVNAFVALEDKRFFEHEGVDYYRTVGAFVQNLKNGYAKQGGSTITQQLAKNTQLSNEKTIIRKIKELKLAKDIEMNYKKEDILELYLNAIYYGSGIYGIESACKKYFDKRPIALLPAEAAILAGIVKNPKKYNPIDNPENAESRMKIVLRLMKEQNYLDESQYNEALSYRYSPIECRDNGSYTAAVLSEASSVLGISEAEIMSSPIVIHTYLEPIEQNKLISLFLSEEYSTQTQDGNLADEYCIVADNRSGGITAYYSVGKTDIDDKRQPGSTIKPFVVYLPALEQGYLTEATPFIDEKKNFNGYSPKNYGDVYSGPVDVETAVMQSINTVAVDIYDKIDRNKALILAKNSGLTIDDPSDNLSIALGGLTTGISGKELTSGYMTIANGGTYKQVGFIKRIERLDGSILYEKSEDKFRAFSEESAFLMTDMLQKTVKMGTAKKLNRLPFSVAAKTGTVGTSSGNSDAWCASFTPEKTICVRIGGENNSEMKSIETTGGGLPTMLISAFLSKIGSRKKYFDIPEGIYEAEIDTLARKKDNMLYLCNEFTPDKYRQKYYFSEKNYPINSSPYFLDGSGAEISIIGLIDGATIQFRGNIPYGYRLFRENVLGGKDVMLSQGEFSEDETILWTDTPLAGLYRYRLELTIEGETVDRKYTGSYLVGF
ncbi:MAG: transglycosylase domain-containing protein [Clostridia bacterium]|nr:transglycosylase domain-containing protein [Clostridia bacterium]